MPQVKAQLIELKEVAGLDFQEIAAAIGCRIETISRIKQSGKAGKTNTQKIAELHKRHFSNEGGVPLQVGETVAGYGVPTGGADCFLARQLSAWAGELGISEWEFIAVCLLRDGRLTYETLREDRTRRKSETMTKDKDDKRLADPPGITDEELTKQEAAGLAGLLGKFAIDQAKADGVADREKRGQGTQESGRPDE